MYYRFGNILISYFEYSGEMNILMDTQEDGYKRLSKLSIMARWMNMIFMQAMPTVVEYPCGQPSRNGYDI